MYAQAPAMTSPQTDNAHGEVVARLAATLGVQTGHTLPPLWHWILFLDPVPPSQLGRDGHRAEGGLIPIDPDLPNRMWAGGRVTFHDEIAIGARLHRETSVIADKERIGRAGKLRIITIRHRIFSDQGLAIEEEQDIVYLAPSLSRATSSPAPPAPPEACKRSIAPDEILLFRFSALTFNAHRIHYDRTYATSVEHYPDLVVHGPLQAILLARHLQTACPNASIRTFDYRAQAPAFVNRDLHLEAWRDANNPAAWTLQTRDPSGLVCMRAQAEIHQHTSEPGQTA